MRATSDRWVSQLAPADRADVVIEAVGHQVATLGHAIEATAPGGTVFYFGGPGSLCVVNSNNGIRVTVDCASPTPAAWSLHAIGWDALTAPACADPVPLCGPVAVEPQSWGQVKSLYR